MDFEDIMMYVVKITFVLMILFLLIGLPIIAWKSSCAEARIYNQRNGTNYTCGDFFWAGSQINQQTQTINIEDRGKPMRTAPAAGF
jgi:hypothetical protein